jgi:cell wall-associated NlpC family hydrolase
VFLEWLTASTLRRLKVLDREAYLVVSMRKPIRFQLVVATGTALVLAFAAPVLSAHADPVYPSEGQVKAAKAAVGDKAAQIAVVEGQLKASNARLVEVQTAAEVASERYNLARILLQERTDAAKAARERAAEAQKIADVASDKMGQFAATTYRQGGTLGQLEAFLSSKGPQDVLDRAAGIQLITDIRSRIMQDADASSVVAGVLRRQAARAEAQQLAAEQAAESARAQAQVQVDLAAAETANIQQQQGAMIAQLATLRNTSVTLERQRQAGLKAEAEARAAAAAKAAAEARAAEQARADARARAAAQARADARARAAKDAANRPPAPSPAPQAPPPPPSRGGAAAAIAFARAQIGEPYVWGAAGPDAWDCSGLTMKAWAKAGVYLSHYTGYQWGETSRVPLADLQPGDLVFFGDSGPGSHHVGLFIGNGQMIEAPHTGALVRESTIWRSGLLPYGGRP